MTAPPNIIDKLRAHATLRQIDLEYFATGGVSPFALLGFGAAPSMTEAIETHLDLTFTVTRQRVRFLTKRRFVREADCRGEPDDTVAAYLMPAIEGGYVIDTVAWHPRSGRLATERGQTGLLGADALACDDEPVVVEPGPMEWLAGFRRGICIVDTRLARPALLEANAALVASDVAHGEALDAMLRKVRVPKIVVAESSIARAAA